MRTRITLVVALLVAATLSGAGVIVYLVEAQRLEEQVTAEVEQELGELAALYDDGQGVDPATGERFANPQRLLRTFLERNVPDEHELLVGWWDGRPQIRSPRDPLAVDPGFVAAVAPLVGRNQDVRVTLPEHGELLVTVQSTCRDAACEAGSAAALVVVHYLDRTRDGLRDTMRTYAIVSLLSLLLVTAAAGGLSGRLLAPLRTLRETAEDITATDLARRLPVSGNDDITALTRTVNGMLDRLEAAFVGQRQFLDDAGHELKTPLTVLRGHLELLDTGSPDEVAETKALLLDEVDRMSRLVGDLILLAKSNRPDFVTRAPVDLAGLAADLLAKARVLGERRWVLDRADRVTVRIDEQRVTQAVLQLADNAVKHTGPGDEIGIGAAHDGDRVRLWVRDTGPGVPEPDRELVFERFGRSVVREGDEGFGLGLSIVRAIAEAHGGTATVTDAVPSGAQFVITLRPPEEPVPPDPGRETAWPGS